MKEKENGKSFSKSVVKFAKGAAKEAKDFTAVEFSNGNKIPLNLIIRCTSAHLEENDLKKLCKDIENQNKFIEETKIKGGNIEIQIKKQSSDDKQIETNKFCIESSCNQRDKFIREKMKWKKEYKNKIIESSKVAIVIGRTGEVKRMMIMKKIMSLKLQWN